MKPSSDITKSVLSNNGGNSLEARMPKKAVHALELMAQGTSWRKVREATGISFAGQAGLKARNGKVLQKRREQMAVDGFETAEKIRMLLSEKLQQLSDDGEALSKTNLKDLVLSRAIEQDKAFAAMVMHSVLLLYLPRSLRPTGNAYLASL